MKLCILTTSYPRFETDDSGVFVARLVEALAKVMEKILVIIPFGGNEPKEENNQNIKIIRYNYGLFSRGTLAFGAGIPSNLKRAPWLIFQAPMLILQMALAAIRNRGNYDFIQANWIVCGVAAYIASFVTNKRYIVTIHGSDMKLIRSKFLRWIFYPILKSASQVVVVSETFHKVLLEKFPSLKDNSFWIPLGIYSKNVATEEIQKIQSKHGFDPTKRYLVTISTVIPLKRVHILIELLQKLPDFHLIVCGRTDSNEYIDEILKKADSLGCRARIHILGSVPPNEVPCYLALSPYFITASSFEGRPNALLEALAMGRIAFASNIDAHQEIIKNGENGFLFDVDKIENLKNYIEQLERDPAALKQISEHAKKSVGEYSWEQTALRYKNILEQHYI